jgi:hypothetical protein
MVIEICTPDKEVNEWIITYVRDAILNLHKQHNEIGRAEVCFRERMKQIVSEKICEIDLSIFKDSVMVTGTGKSFDHAARKAVEELNDTVAKNFKIPSEPPDEIISTVEA